MFPKSYSGGGGRHILAFILVGGCLFGAVSAKKGDGGSVCDDATCQGPPIASCTPSYERDDGCCPVWKCPGGQTAYGMSKSFSSGSGSASSFSFSSGNGSPPPMGGNPLAGIMNSIFGGGGLFG